jgi:tetratricopeptide (TPR) repeat protein
MGPRPVFISYSHDDESWKDRLVAHLGVLEQEGLLEVWNDRRIAAGDDWQPEIEAAMSRAQVAVLLVTASFLTSKFIRGKEIPRLLERRQHDGLRVIPVIVKPCAWTEVGWLAALQCRPKDGRALSGGSEHEIDTALTALAKEIHTQGTAPAHAEVERHAGRDIQRSSPAWLPHRWLLIALAVLSLGALLFNHCYSSRLEAADTELGCSFEKKPEKYKDYFNAGRLARENLDLSQAEESFQKALCAQDLPAARVALAQTLVDLSQQAKAKRILKKAVERAKALPEEERLLVEGQASAMDGDWKKACARFAALHAKKPGDVDIVIALANAQIGAGEYEAALETVKNQTDPRLALIAAKAAKRSELPRLQPLLLGATERAMAEREKKPWIAAQGYLFHALALPLPQQTEEALKELREAEILAAGNKPLTAAILREEGAIYLDQGDYPKAAEDYRQAAKEYPVALVGGSPGAAEIFENQGTLFDDLGDLRHAKKNLELALLVMSAEDTIQKAEIETNLGFVLEHQGELADAEIHLAEAERIYRASSRLADSAEGLCNIAQVEWLQLAPRTPAAMIKRCRELASQSGNQDSEADALATEGDFLLWQGDLVHALDAQKRALTLRDGLQQMDMAADSRLSLAMIYFENSELPQAEAHALNALTYFRDKKSMDWAALAHVLLARIHLARGKKPDAQKEIDKAEERAKASEFLELRVRSALTLAQLAAADGRLREALSEGNRALEEAQRHHHPALELEAHFTLGEIELQQPNTRQGGCERLQKVEREAHGTYDLVGQKAAKRLAGSQPPCPELN